MLVMAIVGAGGIFTGTNPSYTQMELHHHFKASQSRFLISEPEILGQLQAAAKDANIPEENIRVFNVFGQKVPPGMKAWDELLKAGEKDWVRFDDLETCRRTTAARLFSSGTTGLPKATVITHYNLIAQHELVYEAHQRPYQVSLYSSSSAKILIDNVDVESNCNSSLSRRRSPDDPFRNTARWLSHLHHAPFRPPRLLGNNREAQRDRPDPRASDRPRHPHVPVLQNSTLLEKAQVRGMWRGASGKGCPGSIPRAYGCQCSIDAGLGYDGDLLYSYFFPVSGA